MQDKTRVKERRFPLHVHISVLFSLLLLGSGVILGLFNYYQTTQVILSSSNQLFGQFREEVEADLRFTYQPIRHLLGLLALHEANQSADGYQRMSLLPMFAQALRDNPKLASLYLGYEDGDFFMVRPLRDERTRQILDAPLNAAFQVWTIDRSGAARPISESQYFDGDLQWISRRQNLKETYDPRVRPWYQDALGGSRQITTEPYVFFSTGDVGTTLARITRGKTVMGAHIIQSAGHALLEREFPLVMWMVPTTQIKTQTLKSRLHRGRMMLRERLVDFSGGLTLHKAA